MTGRRHRGTCHEFVGTAALRGGFVTLTAGLIAAAFLLTPHLAAPPNAIGDLTTQGSVAPHQLLTFDLVLVTPGQSRAAATLAAIENPASPRFLHLVGPRQYGERFGISDRALSRTEAWLARAGVRVLTAYAQRTALTVRARAATAERLFAVGLVRYRDARGRDFIRARGTPVIPGALRATVQAVVGLDTQPTLVAHDVPLSGIDPAQAALAYDIAPLHRAGYDGQGQTIAIVSFSAYDPADPAAFASEHHLRGPQPRVIAVNGGTTDTSQVLEANLDIDLIRAIAPAARILVYEANNTPAAYADVINTIVKQHRATIISSSWGQCEPTVRAGQLAGDRAALAAAVHAGVTMFVASGDQGAYDCQQSNPEDHRLTVDWPGSSADAVSVGGTRLLLGPSFRYLGEEAWDDQLYGQGGGGGISRLERRPPWQAGRGVIGRWSNGYRQVPDISAASDPGTSWSFYAEGGNATESGTSAAAPFWAGAMALVAQYALHHHAGRLGYENPILYALARRRWRHAPFHDVTRGYNRFYPAARGWDPATGLGSPDVANLAADTVTFLYSLRPHPGTHRHRRRRA